MTFVSFLLINCSVRCVYVKVQNKTFTSKSISLFTVDLVAIFRGRELESPSSPRVLPPRGEVVGSIQIVGEVKEGFHMKMKFGIL